MNFDEKNRLQLASTHGFLPGHWQLTIVVMVSLQTGKGNYICVVIQLKLPCCACTVISVHCCVTLLIKILRNINYLQISKFGIKTLNLP